MREKKVLFMFAAFIIFIFASVSFAAIPVDVTVGKETILNLKEPSKRVSIANPDIAAIVLISPSEIVINGKKPGVTSLIVWNNEDKPTFFDVVVYRERLIELEKEKIDALESKIKSFTADADVKGEFAGDTLVLNGTAKNRQIIDKIEKFAMLYASKGCEGISRSSSLPRTSKETKEEAKEEAQTVKSQALSSVNIVQQAQQQAEQPKAETLCVLNLITISEAQQVILEVKVAQIDKTKLKELGLSIILKGHTAEGFSNLVGAPTSTGASGVGATGGSTGIVGNAPGVGSFDPLDAFQLGVSYFPSGVGVVLKALQEKGFGKILAEPNLVVRSGENGNFHVGSRIPIQTVTGLPPTVSITYEEVGIRLNFAPEVLETGAIRLKIDPAEVSSVARYITFQGIIAPEIDTRRVITSVDLKEGESLILAGLLSEEMKENITKVPILGDIPILGALFRSTREDIMQKELAFFITPRLVKPFAPGVKPALPTDNQPTPDEEREFQWIPLPAKSAPEGKSEPAAKIEEGNSE
jgi:pilus assembly protein CpaC